MKATLSISTSESLPPRWAARSTASASCACCSGPSEMLRVASRCCAWLEKRTVLARSSAAAKVGAPAGWEAGRGGAVLAAALVAWLRSIGLTIAGQFDTGVELDALELGERHLRLAHGQVDLRPLVGDAADHATLGGAITGSVADVLADEVRGLDHLVGQRQLLHAGADLVHRYH